MNLTTAVIIRLQVGMQIVNRKNYYQFYFWVFDNFWVSVVYLEDTSTIFTNAAFYLPSRAQEKSYSVIIIVHAKLTCIIRVLQSSLSCSFYQWVRFKMHMIDEFIKNFRPTYLIESCSAQHQTTNINVIVNQ